MSTELNRPEKIAYWTLLAAEKLECAKHVAFKTGRVDLALEFEAAIDELKRLHELVTSAGSDTQMFSRRPPEAA